MKYNKLNYNCYQYTVSRILQNLQKDYQFVQLGNWGFQYDLMIEKEKCIGDAIGDVCRYDLNKIVFNICGIRSRYYGIEKVTFEEMQRLLTVQPMILAEGDLYYCPWSMAYQQKHIDHYFLIAGFDKKNAYINCYDPYLYENKIFKISINKILKGIKSLTEFWVDNDYHLQKSEIKSYIREKVLEDIEDILDKNSQVSLYNIYVFSDALINKFSIIRENGMTTKEIYDIPLIVKLKMVYLSRYGYADFLRYYADLSINSAFHKNADLLMESAAVWKKCRMLLLKPFIRNEVRGESIGSSGLIEQAGVIEIKCAKNIISEI